MKIWLLSLGLNAWLLNCSIGVNGGGERVVWRLSRQLLREHLTSVVKTCCFTSMVPGWSIVTRKEGVYGATREVRQMYPRQIHVWAVQWTLGRPLGCPLVDCEYICPASRPILAGEQRHATEVRRNRREMNHRVCCVSCERGDSPLWVGGVRDLDLSRVVAPHGDGMVGNGGTMVEKLWDGSRVVFITYRDF